MPGSATVPFSKVSNRLLKIVHSPPPPSGQYQSPSSSRCRKPMPTKAAQASIAMGYSRRHLCQICAGTLRTVVCCICCCAAKKPDIMKNRIVSQPNTYSVWNRSGATKKLTPEKPTPAICW